MQVPNMLNYVENGGEVKFLTSIRQKNQNQTTFR